MAEETYRCTKCAKSFDSRGKFNQHLRTHSKPFQCEHCQKGFALRLDVKRHVYAKHRVGRLSYSCAHAGCGSKFSRKDNLKKHVRSLHGRALLIAMENTAPDAHPNPQHVPDVAITVPDRVAEHGLIISSVLRAVSMGSIGLFEWALSCGIPPSMQGDDGSNAVHCAARAGQATVVKRLVELGCPADALNSKKRTPLHEAIIGQDAESVSALLVENPDLQMRDCYGKSAMEHAMEHFNQEIVDRLLRCISPEDINSGDLAILHLAAKYRRCAFVEKFLAIPGVRADETDYKGKTPLHLASISGSEAIVTQLLECEEVDVNAKVKRQGVPPLTPLYFAVRNGHEEVVKRLLTIRNLYIPALGLRGSPLEIAIDKAHLSIAERLLHDERYRLSTHKYSWQSYTGLDCLLKTTRMGYNILVKSILRYHSVPVNRGEWTSQDRKYETALHCSAAHGNFEASELLLQHHDINPNVQDNAGNTPLHYALLNDHMEIAKLLLTHSRLDFRKMEPMTSSWGTIIGKQAQEETVLEIATRKGQTEIIELLMARDDIDAPTRFAQEQPLATEPMDISKSLQPETPFAATVAEQFETAPSSWLSEYFEYLSDSDDE